jgi:hypothetical protein
VKWLAQFGRFWYDFIVGDDWTIAVAVVAIVAVTSLVAHGGHLAWPILPAGVAAALATSIWRARRVHRHDSSPLAAGGPRHPNEEGHS